MPIRVASPGCETVFRVGGKRVRLARGRGTDSLRDLLQHIDQGAEPPEREILKSDATTTLWLVDAGGGERWVVKRYNTRTPLHVVKRALRTTRAANCWHLAHCYLAVGIATAPPVALVEQRHLGFAGRSWFVNQYVDGVLLSELFAGRQDVCGMEEIAEKLVEIFTALKAGRLSHGDMKATNILVTEGAPLLLDLDAARVHRTAWSHRRALVRDLRRFLRNWQKQPEILRWFETRLQELRL